MHAGVCVCVCVTGGVGSPVDRKISFAVLTERSDSFHSSTTSLSTMDPSAPITDEKKDVRSKIWSLVQLCCLRGKKHALSSV